MKASGSAIFFREAFRNARRWQTYASRTGFAAVMLGMVLLVWLLEVEGPGFDPAAMGGLGATIFKLYSYVQFWLMVVLGSIVVAQGIVEEKEDRTLDMLAITRLTPGQIIRGKLLSRVLVLLVIILSGTPVMALVMSFGGVDPIQVTSVVVNTCVAVLVTGTMASFLALFSRGAILPTVLTVLYTIPAFLVVPGAHLAASSWNPQGYFRFTPAFAPEADAWGILLPALSYAPVLVMTLRIAGPLFEMVTSSGDEVDDGGFGYLSFHLWTFERFKKWGGLLSVIVMLSFPVALLLHNVPGVGEVWATAFLAAGTWLYLLVAMRVVLFLDRTLAKVPSMSLLDERAASKAPRTRKRWLFHHVWRNPVAWRELATRAYGGMSLFIVPGYVVYGAFLGMLLLILLVEPSSAYETATVLSFIIAAAAMVAMLLNATATMVTERRAGTLGLLATTTLPSYRIVAGKMQGVLAYTGPLLLSALVLLLYGAVIELLQRGLFHDVAPDWTVFPGNPLMKAWWTGVWLVAVYVSLMLLSMIASLRIKNPGFAYGVNLFSGMALLLAPAFGVQLFKDIGPVAAFLSVLVPLGSDRFYADTGSTPAELLASIIIHTTVSLGLFTVLCRRLRPWIGTSLR